MSSAKLVALVIYDSKLFNRTGQVRRWADRVAFRFVVNAKQAAPERSGELRAGISGNVTRIGPVHLSTTISSVAPHTMYVLKGTTGPIYSRRMWGFRQKTGRQFPRGGYYMRNGQQVPKMGALHSKGYALRVRAGNGFPERFAVSVSGQDPQNFMGEAATATARRHQSLRGFRPSANFDL